MTQIKTIRDAMRLIAATSAVLLATSAGSTFAHASVDVSGENEGTGAYSANTTDVNVEHNTDLDIKNSDDVKNDLKGDFNTGWNDISFNTLVEDGTTGDIDVNVDVSNDSEGDSLGSIGDLLAASDVSVDFVNRITGAYSDNENNANVEKNTDVNISNKSNVKNKLDIDANTGRNEAIGNTEFGGGTTGDIDVSADISNNTGGSSLGLGNLDLGGGSVDISGGNSITGYSSTNENNVNVEENTDVNIKNDSKIDNKVKLDLNTGGNTTNYNTMSGGNSTGSISADLSLSNTTH
jgi:hypothetical protein